MLLPLLALLLVPARADWRLVWSDEFDRPGRPDPARWTYEHGHVRNREAQFYTRDRAENARVEDGCLVLEARREPWISGSHTSAYTSASLTTRGRASWTGGRIEVRARIPTARGCWPAIWTLGDNIREAGWPRCGEIDILEAVGHEPDTVFANVHTEHYNHMRNNARGSKIRVPDLGGAFHVFAVEWTTNRLAFFLDGSNYFHVARQPGDGVAEWPFDAPQYLILNVAVGGTWGGQQGIDGAAFPQRMLVDYVRVYAPGVTR